MRLDRTGGVGALSVDRVLRLPVRLHGILMGQVVDVLLDPTDWRVVGYEVRCGDGSERFVPFATAEARSDEVAVGSALLLLEEIGFYRSRTRSFRSLLGLNVGGGALRDVLVRADGAAEALVVADCDGERRVVPEAARRNAA